MIFQSGAAVIVYYAAVPVFLRGTYIVGFAGIVPETGGFCVFFMTGMMIILPERGRWLYL